MKNIFIVGPVASGKNALLKNIIKNNDVIALDTGRIFRFLAYEIYNELKDNVDIEKLFINDEDEINKLLQKLFHLTKFIAVQLEQLSFEGEKFYKNEKEIDVNELYKKEVNILLPIMSKISTIREKIVQFIENNVSNSLKPIIMTGHNIKEIDTTKFSVVYLDVDEKQSAFRLYNRNINSYKNVLDAYDEVLKRNSIDKINETKNILFYLYDYIYIDTNEKNEQEVYEEFLIKFSENRSKNNDFFIIQENAISRDKFDWMFNPILEPIREKLKKITNSIINRYPFINQNDLIYQTLILLTSHELIEIYNCWNEEYLKEVESSIKLRDKKIYDKFLENVRTGIITINFEPVINELISATFKLCELYKDEEVKNIMINYNAVEKKSNLVSRNEFMIRNNSNKNKITFRVIDKNMSQFISKYCHYLHVPRYDEMIAYGAFVNDEDFPIAYVSFSKQDRDYKKQLLFNLGIEPQNSIEMTRAWCSNTSPKNIMSSLFQFSINDIANKWKEDCKLGVEDKYLQAVTTAINPNLGFKASSFLGCNFIPIALRPAQFTFKSKDGIIEYETRRKIEVSNDVNVIYFENQFDILPLNELILCLDKYRMKKIRDSKILLIDKNCYENILKGKSLIKKEDK